TIKLGDAFKPKRGLARRCSREFEQHAARLRNGRRLQAMMRPARAARLEALLPARRATQSSVRFGLNTEGMGLKHRMALLVAACLDHQAERHPPSPAMFYTHSHTQFDC